MVLTTENKSGTDLSGSDGESNRVLTLGNSTLTILEGFQVFVDGLFLHPTTDYTLNHLSSNSTITFLNGLFDEQKITVNYNVSSLSPSAGSSGILPFDTQLINNEITYSGDSVTLRAITKTYSDYGDASETTSDTNNVKCMINDLSPEEIKDKEGIMLGADKRFFFQNSQTGVTNGNRIIFNSKTYEIIRVINNTIAGNTYLIEAYGKLT